MRTARADGDLYDVDQQVYDACSTEEGCVAFVCAAVAVLEDEDAPTRDDLMGALAAGRVEDAVHAYGEGFYEQLRRAGMRLDVIARLRAGVWTS